MLSVEDYAHDTVVINLNAPSGETIDYNETASSVTPSSAPFSHSWSSAGDPLTLTVTNATMLDSELSVTATLSAESASAA